ncbi:hypothetical protein [Desulfotalea psychrophila]|uniref:Related to membrane proteins n=1 Tax=Desulfotalea psychrophila (strain LSv54 / DSM 12343) TaxID=177439 RepID=Q6ARQ6_DESPS|nr:hypothetical protein [Desulfotalea psychrophila]CAG34969.1 related to membrane proteins [Desulfotalea psychrophila LSv54]
MEVFNNRELASALLVSVVLLYCLRQSRVRNAFVQLIKVFFQREIVTPFVIFSLFTVGVVWCLREVAIWDTSQVKNTVVWFLFVGSVQLSNTVNVDSGVQYLKRALKQQFQVIVLIEFLVAFHSYGFITELILVTVSTFIACCSVVASTDPKFQKVKSVFGIALSILGIYLFIDSLSYVSDDVDKFFNISTLRDFLVPMLLSVSIIPYVYCFYCYITYEKAYIKTRIYTDSSELRRYAKFKSFIEFRGNPEIINCWLCYSCIPEFKSKQTIAESIHEYKKITTN